MAFLEIRTYRLKPGTRDDFVRVMRERAVPLLGDFGVLVMETGPSLDGPDEAYLIRAFESLKQREEQETAFYGSAQWREGPREAIVSRIEGVPHRRAGGARRCGPSLELDPFVLAGRLRAARLGRTPGDQRVADLAQQLDLLARQGRRRGSWLRRRRSANLFIGSTTRK